MACGSVMELGQWWSIFPSSWFHFCKLPMWLIKDSWWFYTMCKSAEMIWSSENYYDGDNFDKNSDEWYSYLLNKILQFIFRAFSPLKHKEHEYCKFEWCWTLWFLWANCWKPYPCQQHTPILTFVSWVPSSLTPPPPPPGGGGGI